MISQALLSLLASIPKQIPILLNEKEEENKEETDYSPKRKPDQRLEEEAELEEPELGPEVGLQIGPEPGPEPGPADNAPLSALHTSSEGGEGVVTVPMKSPSFEIIDINLFILFCILLVTNILIFFAPFHIFIYLPVFSSFLFVVVGLIYVAKPTIDLDYAIGTILLLLGITSIINHMRTYEATVKSRDRISMIDYFFILVLSITGLFLPLQYNFLPVLFYALAIKFVLINQSSKVPRIEKAEYKSILHASIHVYLASVFILVKFAR